MSYLDKVTVGSTTYDIQDTKAQGDIVDLKSATDEKFASIADIPENVVYVTNGATGTQSSVTYSKKAGTKNALELYGTSDGLVCINPFNGANEKSNSNSINPTKYLTAGKYTIYFSRSVTAIGVFYTESTGSNRTELSNGQTITVGENGGAVYLRIANGSAMGTSENPAVFSIKIYQGENVSDVNRAIDGTARNELVTVKAFMEDALASAVVSVQLSDDDVYDNFYANTSLKTLVRVDTATGKKATKLIPVFGGKSLTVTSFCNGAYGIVFFDRLKNPISSFADSTGTHTRERTITLPDGCAYFAATINASDYTEPSDLDISYVFDPVRYAKTFDSGYRISEPYELLLRSKTSGKLLCIGDSLTESANENDITYPQLVALKTGLECTNVGESGYTSKEWWTEVGSQYDFSSYDAFVIWLGTNGQLTDTLDTDVVPYSDYNDFADTQTGYYCRIIAKIISQVPKAKIFLVGVYAGTSTEGVSVTNNVIDQIADLYDDNVVGVISTRQRDIYTNNQDGILHPYDGLHFGKYGNFVISEIIIQGMRKLIKDRPELFARYNSPIE